MTHYTASTVHGGWVPRTLCRLRIAVQPYITAILAAVDAHACACRPSTKPR
jgi:hypothetical protein